MMVSHTHPPQKRPTNLISKEHASTSRRLVKESWKIQVIMVSLECLGAHSTTKMEAWPLHNSSYSREYDSDKE